MATKDERLGELWSEHDSVQLPGACLGRKVGGIDLVQLDAAIAGHVSRFLLIGKPIGPDRIADLRALHGHGQRVTRELSGPEHRHFARLTTMAALLLELAEPEATAGPGPAGSYDKLGHAIGLSWLLTMAGCAASAFMWTGLAALVFLPVILAGIAALVGAAFAVASGIVAAVPVVGKEGFSPKLLFHLSVLLLPPVLAVLWFMYLFGVFG